jgi:hypothetical protein
MGYAEGCNSAALDYSALATWCRARKGQAIVCEQDGADWLPFEHLRHARNSIGVSTAEVMWTDAPPAETQQLVAAAGSMDRRVALRDFRRDLDPILGTAFHGPGIDLWSSILDPA